MTVPALAQRICEQVGGLPAMDLVDVAGAKRQADELEAEGAPERKLHRPLDVLTGASTF